MKRIFALLLALAMLFALTACGGDDESPESTGTSNSTTESTNYSTEGTESTTESSTGGETTDPPSTTPPTTDPPVTDPPSTNPPTTTSPETEQPHTHSYTSKVTTSATCDTDGVKTLTCSCGNSYTDTITATGHSWGDWKVKAIALVGKSGTEQRVCSVCSASDTKDSNKNAAFNSFHDWGLVVFVMNDYGSINASTLLGYACCMYDEYHDIPVASATIFDDLSAQFDIDFSDTLKNEMKDIGELRNVYNKTTDTFELHVYGMDPGEFKLLGYVHNGGNKYTIYYSFTPLGIDTTLNFAIELEYNRLNSKPNKYLSIGRADALPNDMIKSS